MRSIEQNGAKILVMLLVTIVLFAGTVCVRASGIPAPDWDDPEYVKRVHLQEGGADMAEWSDRRDENALDASAVTRSDPYTGKVYEHGDRLDGVRLITGVDVSKWQGTIDWNKVAADGIEFAFIRCGYSTLANCTHYQDPYFEANVKGAKAAGLKIGVYYFSQARTKAEAEEEAAFTLSILNGVKLDLPVMFDYESDPGYYNYGLSKAQGTLVCVSFCDRIRSAGYATGVYAGQNYMQDGLYPEQLEEDNVLWIARYNSYVYSSGYTGYIPNYTFWQFSDRGNVAGIGSADMDYWYYREPAAEKEPVQDSSQDQEEPERYSRPKLTKLSCRLAGMKVEWSAVDGCRSYRVLRKEDGGEYCVVGDTRETSYTDGSVVSDKVYTYTVCCLSSVTGEVCSDYSEKGITGRYLAPIRSADITLSNRLAGMQVSWKKVAGASGYRVYRKTSGGNYSLMIELDSWDSTSWVDETGTSGVRYTYAVRAVCSDAIGSYAGRSHLWLDPVTASNMKVKNVCAGIRVEWNAIDGAEGYVIYRKSASGSYQKIGISAGGDRTLYTDEKADSGVTYTYAVRAYCGETMGSYKGKSIMCLAPVRASQMSVYNAPKGITVKWQEIAGAEGYRIYRALKGGTYEKVKDIEGKGTTSWTDTTAVSGTSYVYCVRAVNKTTLGSYQGTGVLALSAINTSDLILTNLKSGIRIQWPAVKGASEYRVYRKVPGGSYVRIKTITGSNTLSYTDMTAVNGNTYVYCVRAVSGTTLGGYSGREIVRKAV